MGGGFMSATPVLRYLSTRGAAPATTFSEVLLTGLAPDGGLYVPDRLPELDLAELARWGDCDYAERAARLIEPFLGDAVSGDELRELLRASYEHFSDPQVAPLRALDGGEHILELFHGPTLSFKDYALQFIGRLLDRELRARDEHAVVLGATSGDTGSAAIEGCRHSPRTQIFILHPVGRVSEMQRLQMTTAPGANVHNLAMAGTFDDCQAIVKACFSDAGFVPSGHRLVAANSINWARIMAQIPYYFSAWIDLGAPAEGLIFSVPTGNFGDIFAGYLARRMGLPVRRLIVGTNSNAVLHGFFQTGRYQRGKVQRTLSPSMDIAVASNFERLLFDLCGRDGAAVADWMAHFQRDGSIDVPSGMLARAKESFASAAIDDEEMCQTLAEVWRTQAYLLDPHSAIALAAGRRQRIDGLPLVSLATAHPGKFSEALERAIGEAPPLPPALAALSGREERLIELPAELDAVRRCIRERVEAAESP